MPASPAFWQQAWDDAQPRMDAIRQSLESVQSSSGRILRIGQLDAEVLDQELLQIIKEPIEKALRLLSSGWDSLLEPELSLIIQLLLYKFSIWDSGATYGAKLQSLRYAASRKASRGRALAASGLPMGLLLLHGTATIGLPYANKRIRMHALSNAWPDAPSFDRRRKLWELLTRLEAAHASLGLLSFILFLWNGRYRTIADRIFGLRLVPSRAVLNRNVSYEFMNRQMVWHAFTEFLLFLLPILNTRALRRRMSRVASNFDWKSFVPPPFRAHLGPSLAAGTLRRRGPYSLLPENQCAICAEDASMDLSLLRNPSAQMQNPSIPDQTTSGQAGEEAPSVPTYPIKTPYRASCGHIYCYVCIADRILRTADDGEKYWECLRCDERVTHASRWETANSPTEDVRHGRPVGRSAGSDESAHVQRRWGSIVSSSVSRLGYGAGGYGTSSLDDSELSALDLDSVSSMDQRTQSDSGELSGE